MPVLEIAIDLKATANHFRKGVVKVADDRFTLSYYER